MELLIYRILFGLEGAISIGVGVWMWYNAWKNMDEEYIKHDIVLKGLPATLPIIVGICAIVFALVIK